MNAIKFLKQEHSKVRRKLMMLSKASKTASSKIDMFYGLCKDLVIHETMEEKVWYPHFKSNPKIKSEVKHLISEEKGAAKIMKTFKSIKSEADWEKKFPKFKKAVAAHAKEEESKLFPNVKKILSAAELNEIGKRMQAFKTKYSRLK